VKFYLDENLSPQVADIARGRCGLDVLTAHDIEAFEWSDEEQLRYAAMEGRCLVTCDRDDFTALSISAFESETPHAGVLIVPSSIPNDRFAMIAAALCDLPDRFPNGIPPYTCAYLTAS
jgi:predicted nuclease of predicted toxin-antitoxin system